jgi:beta-lactamase regulating signal transducer with metallopeptidase domain
MLEIFVSLSVQITLVIGLTAWLTSRGPYRASADACWSMLHVGILLLTATAFMFPHVRWITWADFEPSSGHPALDSFTTTAGRICSWAWFSGTALFLGVCVAGIYRATILVRRAAIDPSVGQADQQELTDAVERSEIETRVSQDHVSPFCWQLHRPVIVVPQILRSFPRHEQAAILRHELAHLRLQHPLHLFLQRMTEALYWYHPLVWWSSRRAAAAREFRCDRDAVRSRREVAHYLRSLLRLIELKVHPPGRLPAGIGFMGDASLLTQRANKLGELTEYSSTPRATLRGAAAIVAAALMCSLIWLPVNPDASRRSAWSPWPTWSARALYSTGIVVRDYEVDGHRLSLHNHDR